MRDKKRDREIATEERENWKSDHVPPVGESGTGQEREITREES